MFTNITNQYNCLHWFYSPLLHVSVLVRDHPRHHMDPYWYILITRQCTYCVYLMMAQSHDYILSVRSAWHYAHCFSLAIVLEALPAQWQLRLSAGHHLPMVSKLHHIPVKRSVTSCQQCMAEAVHANCTKPKRILAAAFPHRPCFILQLAYHRAPKVHWRPVPARMIPRYGVHECAV